MSKIEHFEKEGRIATQLRHFLLGSMCKLQLDAVPLQTSLHYPDHFVRLCASLQNHNKSILYKKMETSFYPHGLFGA